MLGITNIGVYIPETYRSNFDLKDKFAIDDEFIKNRIGVERVSVADESEQCSDLCVKSFHALKAATQDVSYEDTEVLVVITQNPDYKLPHVSAIVQNKLGISKDCACFDISLGCSGYVYGLSVITSFMQQNGFSKGLLFTSDPYSKIVNKDDKNTSLLFGDAATVSYISPDSIYAPQMFSFGTDGSGGEGIICRSSQLEMDGRAVFNFAAKTVPKNITKLLDKANIPIQSVDKIILHQGSKTIVDTISRRLGVSTNVDENISQYGNTVSSSIPIILANSLKSSADTIVISGFGVGLSWGSAILKRNK